MFAHITCMKMKQNLFYSWITVYIHIQSICILSVGLDQVRLKLIFLAMIYEESYSYYPGDPVAIVNIVLNSQRSNCNLSDAEKNVEGRADHCGCYLQAEQNQVTHN